VTTARAGIVVAAALTLLPALGFAGSRQVRGRFGRPPARRGAVALPAVPDALDVSVPGTGNARLRGWFLTGTAPHEHGPAALVMHGWGGSALDMAPLAAPLREAGVHTLLLDARGHGRSDDCAVTSMPHFAEDVAAGLSWLRAHPLVDPARIVLVGHSVGAGACLLAAHRDPGVVGVVSLSCMADPRAVMTRLLSGAHLPRAVLWLVLRYVEHAIGMRFTTFAPLTTLATLTMPVLLIHGELDQVVPVADAHQLAAVAPAARLLLVADVGHADIDGVAAVSDTVREFVARATQSQPAAAP
jgi:pimeloyl-ACP methyl ester carboxylesterase